MTLTSTGPDCQAGKHRACDGRGFDLVADEVIRCGCGCHGAEHTAHRARAIVNFMGDMYAERITSDDWVPVRQATNDAADAAIAHLLREHELEVLDGLAKVLGEEYERVTAQSGAFGATKYRAALRTAESFARSRAATMRDADAAAEAARSTQ